MAKIIFYSASDLLLFIFLFLILSTAKLSARPLVSKQGQEIKAKLHDQISIGISLEEDEVFDMNNLEGVEKCEEEDGECLERRMASEAHLDYIYTQHHRP